VIDELESAMSTTSPIADQTTTPTCDKTYWTADRWSATWNCRRRRRCNDGPILVNV